ncbi:nSTAND1 domain-containing NTPase, partial [Zoogloea oryzae]|uniref:nSTAND1 domain-containing NTPase n=1 Tax=Zoogloea oryzae TaxID=310767 RepID=UPI0024E09132
MNAPAQPYPGIRPFREDEEYLFFGRESQVDAMVDTLARGRFLAVIGSSGCGKSSLVNCGLRPALHRGLLTRAGSAWRMASCRPGGHPIRALAQSLASPGALHREMDAGPFSLAEFIETTLAMSRRGLVEVWQQARQPEGSNLLVIVDQFEELFRYRQLGDTGPADEDPATAFVNLLLQARAEDVPIHIVLTMRSDFLGDCARFAGLPEAINGGQYLVPRMSRDDRRAAILGPARVCGADIEPTLLTRLVNDVGDDPDQLSLLQHALARCWAHWQASGEPSPVEARHYDAVGTLAHALNQHAEEIFATLPPAHQLRCAAAFRALTDTSTDTRGIRRPTRFATLEAITAGNFEAAAAPLAEVLEPFRAPGAAFLMPPAGEPLEADTVIDLAHESLMRIWDRLREWGEREADAARMLRRLADA